MQEKVIKSSGAIYYFYKKNLTNSQTSFFFLKKALSFERVYLYGVSVVISLLIARGY